MDLFISTTGRAVEVRGDSLLLAENLASHMSIEPTADFGLRVTSSGAGIERLYLRQNDVPAQPGVWLEQLEAAGENLKSATIQTTISGRIQFSKSRMFVVDELLPMQELQWRLVTPLLMDARS